jgi:serine protease DegS
MAIPLKMGMKTEEEVLSPSLIPKCKSIERGHSMKKTGRFLLESILVGITAAVLIVLIFPDWLKLPGAQVARISTDGQNPSSYAQAVSQASPAVVNIFTSQKVQEVNPAFANDPLFKHFYGDEQQPGRKRNDASLGSGVIINPNGYLLTNFHVVRNADKIQVMLEDGRVLGAELVGSDRETDLAVLKINDDNLPKPVVASPDELHVGDVVLAIGNPYGVGKTVTMGIISATGRSQLGINTIEDFIQTDAAINPGNSGGALVNAKGELIGINSAIYSESGGSQGIGFAIPITLAQDVLEQILQHGHVIRGWLGVEGQDITPALAESFGLTIEQAVLVAGVVKDGPAFQAGLKPGDIITEIDDAPIISAYAAFNYIAQQKPGNHVKITGLRGGNSFTTKILVAERPEVL